MRLKMAVIEENIVLREDGQRWKYSLSNNLDEIRDAIYKRVRIKIDKIEDVEWEINLKLSQDVKDLMQKYNVVYSMTAFFKNDIVNVVINKREKEQWLFFGGVIFNDEFFSYYDLDKSE
jgi:hypothetical protein